MLVAINEFIMLPLLTVNYVHIVEALNDENDELDIDDSLRPERLALAMSHESIDHHPCYLHISIEVDDFSGEERSIHPEIAATMRSDFVRVVSAICMNTNSFFPYVLASLL